MLNATHYDWTKANIRHGLDISRRVGGKHFIINTAENGRGPVHYKADQPQPHIWRPSTSGATRACADWGRLPPPTPRTRWPTPTCGSTGPGYAQSCQGRKIAWYPPRALSYARYATDWESPPRGTRFGHKKHHPLSAFGIGR